MTAIAQATPPRILSPLILAELDYFIIRRGGVTSELRFLAEITKGVYELASFDLEDLQKATKIIKVFQDLRIGLAEASIVILANRYRCRDILTLDERHFRPLQSGGRAFRILPADA